MKITAFYAIAGCVVNLKKYMIPNSLNNKMASKLAEQGAVSLP